MPLARIPLSALRVPDGKIALTLDLHGPDPMSIVLDAVSLEGVLSLLDEEIWEAGGRRNDRRTHVILREAVALAMAEDDDSRMGAVTHVLWLALNHPDHADAIRAKVSDALREKGRCHLSVTVDARQNWAFAIADRWIDMSRAMAAVPDGLRVSFARDGQPPQKPPH